MVIILARAKAFLCPCVRFKDIRPIMHGMQFSGVNDFDTRFRSSKLRNEIPAKLRSEIRGNYPTSGPGDRVCRLCRSGPEGIPNNL